MEKEKEHRTFDVGISSITDWRDRVNCRVIVLRDVTDRKRVQEDLKHHSERLEELVREKAEQEERLSALNLHGEKLNTAENLLRVYELTLDAMEKTLGFEYAAFMVVEKNCLSIAGYRGYSKPSATRLQVDEKRGLAVRAIRTREPVLVPDVSKDKDYGAVFPSIRSKLAVPILEEDKALGVLDVGSKELGAFSGKDVTLLQILASHAAVAMSNLSRREEIEKRSSQMVSLMKNSAEMIY